MIRLCLALLFALVLALPGASSAWADSIASGTWGTCPWELDSEGKLTVNPGEAENTQSSSPWANYAEQITSVVFAEDVSLSQGVTLPGDVSSLFAGCKNLASLDLSGCNVSAVSEASSMLAGCIALREIRLPAGMGIDEDMQLNNNGDYGWKADEAGTARVSGNGTYAVIEALETLTAYSWREGNDITVVSDFSDWVGVLVNGAQASAAKTGETVALLATPTDGYVFDSFIVKQGETDVPVTDKKFTMPAGDVTVTATFKKTAIDSGTCGDNLTWALYTDGELVVSGTGEMLNSYYNSTDAWASYKNKIITVNIESGVTSIGSEAFRGCMSLASVSIPSSVKKIGVSAFRECHALTNMVFPSGVEIIDENAFAECTNLASLTIAPTVNQIKSNAFRSCNKLTDIYISDLEAWCSIPFAYPAGQDPELSPFSCTHDLYLNGTLLTELVIPESVTSIPQYAFWGCRNITSVSIPSTVTSIGGYAFASSGLTDVTIPNNVTFISSGVFYNCENLASVTLPEGITRIVSDTFNGCSSLTSMIIPSDVEKIQVDAFRDCGNLISITIPKSVLEIQEGAFRDCSSLTDVYYNGTQAEWTSIETDSYNTSLLQATLHCIRTITVSDSENGSIVVMVDGEAATTSDENKTVTLTITPDTGYVLDTLTVMQGETEVTVTDNSFTMPAGDVSVTATFSAWKWLQEEMKKDGEIILGRDYLCDDQILGPLVVPGGVTLELDLNGHTIDRGLSGKDAVDYGSVIVVYGTLTVKDSKPTAAHDPVITYTDPTDSTKTVTVTGGVITGGNSANEGGSVYVGGTFNMQGGSISGNSASYGGGVYVESGSFTLESGSISGNSAVLEGGGVCIYSGGTFNMQGGSISGNSADVFCGGVYVSTGSFTLSGSPEITGNTKGTGESAKASNVFLNSGIGITVGDALSNTKPISVTMDTYGVFTSGWQAKMGTADPAQYFTSEDAVLSVYRDAGGEARLSTPYIVSVGTFTGGSVALVPARSDNKYGTGETVTLLATPSDGYAFNSYTVTDADGQAVAVSENNTFTMPAGDVSVTAAFSQWKWLQNALAKDGTVTLTNDISCDDQTLGPLVVPGGVTLELDLNGHVIDRGLGTSTGTPTGNVITVGGNLTVKDSAPSTTHEPSITYTDPIHSNTVTVTGGVITGGNATQYRGGGVYIYGIGSFTLNGGAISGNSADLGGGVSLYRGSFTMSGGEVSGNSAQLGGGGVNVNEGSFTLAGGAISGNSAGFGGGVNFITGVNNSFKVKGSGKVTGNKESDVYLNSGRKITVDGILNDDAEIVVSMPATGVFTEGYREIMGDADPAQYFTSRLSGWNVYLDAEGEARLSRPYTVSVGTFTGGSVALVPARSDNKYGTGETVTLTITPAAGYIPDTLTVKQGDNTVIVTDNQFTMPAGNVTVSATFQPIPATAPTIGTQLGDLSLIYGYTTGNVLSVEASAADGHALSYQWYSNTNDTNEGGTAIPGAAEASYTVPAGRSAGTTEYYYCVVTATRTDNSQTASTASTTATVSIGKATPTISTAPTASAITYGQTLAGSTLTDGTASVDGSFAWKDSNVAPAVSDSQTTEYDVVFTPTDANYGTAACKVKLTVNKARAAVTTAPTASAITYGQTLAGSALTGGTASLDGSFAWKDSNIAPAVSDSQTTEYDVVFTPTDGNYATAACKVKLTVNKAGAAVTTAPAAKTLSYTGSAQKLVNAGEATGGTMHYALGTAAEAAGSYTASIPIATEIGTYYVWYKVVGDANHSDTAAECAVTVIVPVFGPATFILPAGVRTIEANAFEGLPMTIVEIPDGCTSIGAKAFKDCANLTQIRIPASVTSIDTTAFEGCANVFVYGTAGSAAQTFCADHANCAFVAEN